MICNPTSIPARIVVGITGHRKVSNEGNLAGRVKLALEHLLSIVSEFSATPVVLAVLTPLAEGADRLFAREALKIENSKLEVVLPFENQEYEKDFKSEEAVSEFRYYLAKAARVHRLSREDRPQGYKAAGKYVVDECDVLIAIWDGKASAGEGGTAEVVSYARRKQCPLIWISTESTDEFVQERMEHLRLGRFRDLDLYNREPIDENGVRRRAELIKQGLLAEAKNAGFISDQLEGICDIIIPHYARADLLARRYKPAHFASGVLLYALSAGAVAIAAIRTVFLPTSVRLGVVEVVLMVAVLLILFWSFRSKWHTKWVDYRFLAERFRTALFVTAANLQARTARPPRHLSLAYSATDWVRVALSSVLAELPCNRTPGTFQFASLRKFLIGAWVQKQRSYHQGLSRHFHNAHQLMDTAGTALFATTLLAALLHLMHFGPQKMLTFLTISFPAAGAALAAIRTHGEYLRNSRRSEEMVHHIEEITEKMEEAEGALKLYPSIRELEETMVHESEDWRVIVLFHPPELPA